MRACGEELRCIHVSANETDWPGSRRIESKIPANQSTACRALGAVSRLRVRRSSVVISHLLRYPRLTWLHMIDIHCHLLPAPDDGPDSFEMSLEMAEMAITDGVTHVIATPHAHPHHVFDPELIKKRRDEMQARVEGRLILATGCDFHMSFENLQDVQD